MKKVSVLAVIIAASINLYAADRPRIYSLINKEIFLNNTFAGETITLVKENDDYFVIRQILRSGLPGGPTLKYEIEFYSDYQIRFSKIISSEINSKDSRSEEFILSIIDEGNIEVFLNGLEIVVVRIGLFEMMWIRTT